ncbi:hypothetical protein [Sulfolobus tengchongensis spindle-shaped virus 3]|nr:hypothetical protein [Sulfolobus tengchongensis spindle-shaped virus 3]
MVNSKMVENLNQIPAQMEGEIRKQHIKIYEFTKQLKGIVINKLIDINTGELTDTITKYIVLLQSHAEDYETWRWVEPVDHLLYLSQIKAKLEVYTILGKSDMKKIEQKLAKLEEKVYKTISLIYAVICSEKSDRLSIIQEIINNNVEARFGNVINNIDAILSRLENVNISDEPIKILVDNVFNETKQFREEIVKFKNEKVEITSVGDIVMFIKKFSKLLEQSALISTLFDLIYIKDEQVYKRLFVQQSLPNLADNAYYYLFEVLKDISSNYIEGYEHIKQACADKTYAEYYTTVCGDEW